MFTARRKPKKIAVSDARDEEEPPVVVRPKSKKRISTYHDDDDDTQIPVPKLGPSSISLQADRSGQSTRSPSNVISNTTATQSTNIFSNSSNGVNDALITTGTQSLDIASKFGPIVPKTSIPSATEIAEKKARRSRLAAEHAAHSSNDSNNDNRDTIASNHDFIALDDDEFNPRQLSTYTADPESRNVPDDDLALFDPENLISAMNPAVDGLKTSGRLHMQPVLQSREDIRAIVEDSSEDSDGSADLEFVTKQMGNGLAGDEKRRVKREMERVRMPGVVPVPVLPEGVERVRMLQKMAEERVTRSELRRGEIKKRLGEIEEEKGRIQMQLEELGRGIREIEERKIEMSRREDDLQRRGERDAMMLGMNGGE